MLKLYQMRSKEFLMLIKMMGDWGTPKEARLLLLSVDMSLLHLDLMGIEITKTIAYIAAVGSECDILTSINAM